ncbi:DUF748 domain-containing protein [Shewanella decolorationis]|uniref:Atpase involved in pili biogenesis n=1 Tax=Shewanella decolorationis S12 TaxID=1353536 RepID=A0ABP2Z1H9_9GAMM|nr:DUF748 domain-containing protein [Shewanella decolorationis]ESE40430.1 atpase involved in pili biogenesis [Shewanella decolorationis S12]GLR30678.1 hypothetical protein GCM10007922_02350 [Shewanella decolorationis]
MLTQLSRLKLAFFSRPRYQRVLAYLTIIYLSYLIILGLVLPKAVVSFAPEKLAEVLGRPVTLQNMRVNPFTFQVNIEQFEVKEKDNQAFAGLSQLQFEVNFWQSVFNQAVVIDHIQLQGPFANMSRFQTQGKTQFNFDDIITTLNQAKTPSEPETATESTHPPRVILGEFRLTAGKVKFDDKITKALVDYPNINFKLSQLDTEYLMTANPASPTNTQATTSQDKPTTQANSTSNPASILHNQFVAQLQDAHAGEVSLAGQFQLFPFKLVGDAQLAKLQLAPLWPFVADQFKVKLAAGELSISSHYQVELPTDGNLQLTADRSQVIVEKVDLLNGDQSVIALPLLAIDGINLNLTKQRVDIKQIHSEGLSLKAKLDEQGIDLAQLLMPKTMAASTDTITPNMSVEAQTPEATVETNASVASASQAVSDTSATEQQDAWLVTLGGLSIENYDIHLEEHKLTQTAQQWRVYPLNFTTQAIVSDLKAPIEYELSFALNDKGRFISKGQVDVPSESINADLKVERLALAQFQPYLAPYVNMQLSSGLFSSEGKLNADGKGKAIYQGSVELDDLSILDNIRKAPLVKWQKMHINQLDFDQQLNKINIDHLSFNQPYAKVVIAKDRTTNISNLIVETPATDAPKTTATTAKTEVKLQSSPDATAKQPELSLDIQKISFNQGSAFFADNSLTPNFASGIEQLEGNISHLSSKPGTTASVDIKGKIDRYAPVTLKGDINPLLDKPYLDLDLVFKSVELTSVNPYSGTYAGYYIDKGQLSLALNYKLEQNQLKGSNHLVIDQLKLGKRSNSDLATSLPVTLAIALLQDRHGVIDLGMEVSGDLDSPSFSVGSIIMTAITNVITKAVTAPFSFLAGLVGSDETLDKIPFNPGQFVLSPTEQESLDKLAKGLDDRPMLKLSLEGSVDAVKDSQAIAERMMKRKLATLANLPLTELPADLSPSQFPSEGPLADALVKLYEQEVKTNPDDVKDTIVAETKDTPLSKEELTTRWHIALYNLTLKAQTVSPDRLGDLAQERAKAVKAYLVDSKGIAPERIFLLESRVTLSQDAAQVNMSIDAN